MQRSRVPFDECRSVKNGLFRALQGLCILVLPGLGPALDANAADADAPAAAPAAAPAQPLYEYIRNHIDRATGVLPPEAMTLPDEPPGRRFSRLRWTPGALEGLGTRHIKWDGGEKASRVAHLLEWIAAGNNAAEPVLYELLRVDDVVTFYSDALDFAAERVRNPEPQLHALARRLATQSDDRGPVKFGIAMLGSMGDEHDLPIVQTLALHEEFGLYAAEALAEIAPDRQAALYDMARKVTGWGRIEAVSRMVATRDPDLRRWLLTEGFRNTVTPQYLAYRCATIADLAGALADTKADTSLLLGAADLIQAMVKPGPAVGFDNYAEAPEVSRRFLEQVVRRRDSASFFLAADALQGYVAETKSEAWTAQDKARTASLAAQITSDKRWRRTVLAALTDDAANLDDAESAAQKLHINTLDLHVKHLKQKSANPHRWELAFAAADPMSVKRLVDVAQRTLGTRPPSTRADPTHNASANAPALEAVLRGIAQFPGSGLPLLEDSLADRDNRVRQAAVETLVRWGSPYLRDASVRLALDHAANAEADEALKARMVALLNLGTP